MDRNYWQIAAGSKGRDNAENFLSTGMAFVGGKTQEDTMTPLQLEDVVVLKKGLSKIVAVGEVIEQNGIFQGNGNKEWLNHFDGWQLPAYCYVAWRKPDKPMTTTRLTIATIQQLPRPKHQTLADELLQTPIHPIDGEPTRHR